METTKKLYDLDAYGTEFEAKVLTCEEVKKKDTTGYAVTLDQTLFFPEEGGQSPDQGTINGISVLDVQIKKDVIIHTLAAPVEVGSTVKGKIDWKHRFYNMQQHSGEHIFSGLVHSRFGYENVGFHLSDQTVTMDFNGVLSEADVAEVEYAVNEAIIKNIPIEVTFPTKEELETLDYRSKIEIEGQVRIVTIPGYDVCACCAPHVKRTGEIGMLKVLNVQSYKGGVRISILCGFRALLEFRKKAAVLSELSAKLSANQEGLGEAVDKLKNTNQAMKAKLAAANEKMMQQKLSEIPSDQTDVLLFEEDLDVPVMRNAVNALVEAHSGICGIFAGSDADGYHYIVGSRSKDCREAAAALREKFGAKGGGKPEMVQGSVTASEADIRSVLE